MIFKRNISTLPFIKWIMTDEENKKLLWFSITTITISFILFKTVYPYPNFMPPDSNNYMEAAANNDFISIWPIGYSKFLQLIHVFTRSHMILIVLQYLLLLTSTLYFLFTVRYLLSPSKWLFRILLLVSIGNPLLAHISNFVSSDSLFATLSLVWFTQLLWIIYRPSPKLLLIHAFILLLAFTVRYTAIYYPFVSIFVLIVLPITTKERWIGTGSISFLLLIFIGRTQYEYQKKTGTIQYSAFGGWQIAANALYGYAYAKPDDPLQVPSKFRELHIIVNHHMDSLHRLKQRPDQEVGIYYLWDLKSPLRLYMNKYWKNDTKIPWFKKWAFMAPLYQQYGRYLVMKHPFEFIRCYIWPNFIKYYAPPVKFMGMYNMGFKTVDPITVTWFGWANNELPLKAKDRQIRVTAIFSIILSIINPLFLLTSIAFVIFGGFKKCNTICKQLLGLTQLIWFGNMFFSILSAPIELRYQLFPIIITIPFCGLFIMWIIQSLQNVPSTKQQQLIPIPEPAPLPNLKN